MSTTQLEPPKASSEARRRTEWLTALGAITGLAGYLAVLGAALLAFRFAHAGLPVGAALSTVPFATMVTTAATKLVVSAALPCLVLAVLVVVTSRDADSRTHMPSRRTVRLNLAIRVLALVGTAITLPLDAYGITESLCFGIVIFGAAPITMKVHSTWPRLSPLWVYTALAIVLFSMPVFARELASPADMETVKVTNGSRTLVGGLVAIRDGSVVIARCRRLAIVPLGQTTTVAKAPGMTTSGRSLLQVLGVGPNPAAKPGPPPCAPARTSADTRSSKRRAGTKASTEPPKTERNSEHRRPASTGRSG